MTNTADSSTQPGHETEDHSTTPLEDHAHGTEPHSHEHSHQGEHSHEGEHGHEHATPGESIPEFSETGSVIIDIGGDVGAAVINTPAALNGREIEIRPAGGEWDGTHVAVIPRHLGAETIYAALFPALKTGGYQVRERFGPPDGVVVDIDVVGAIVQRFTWPEG
jgi:hypothetical protein